jgi:PAS domain S-box-containing protein
VSKDKAKQKAVENASRKDEKLLSQIVQGSPIPTFVIDNDHVITLCNKAFENLTGKSADQMLGTRKQWVTFYDSERPVMADLIVDNASPQEFERFYGAKCKRSTVTEGGYEAEDFFPALGEEGRWILFNAAPLRDADGNIKGAIETLQDITDRKKAEEARRRSARRIRILLDFVPYPIVVFDLKGHVFYLNSAFTDTFGWNLEELEGKHIPYVPPGLEEETREMIAKLLQEKVMMYHETKRLTKDGQVLDVVMRAAVYYEAKDKPAGEIVILRDITKEKRIARHNEAVLRISKALPEYPDLEELLDYVSKEVKQLLHSEGALVMLLDEEQEELYFPGAAYDDRATQRRVKEIRFKLDEVVAGRVIRTGEPILENDSSRDIYLYPERDKKLGYETRNYLEVPLRSSDRIIGVLCAINKKEGGYEDSDVELLNMIAGTVSLSIENARYSDELKRAYRNDEALLRISTALPEYTELEGLLDYISDEVKRLIGTEGALVVLLDDERKELFFLGVAYDDSSIRKRVKEIRFSMDQLVAGEVIRTGKPLIVPDTSKDPALHLERDKRLGYQTKNLLLVPLRSSDRIIGVLCAINKKEGAFGQRDVELLGMIAGTVALSIENARFSDDLKKAYMEVTSLNRAKDKVINHLSHELKTPISVLLGSLNVLKKKLMQLPEDSWKPTADRLMRNLGRITEIQEEVEDIMKDRQYEPLLLLSMMVEQCTDELETLVAEEAGEGPLIGRIRERIQAVFGTKEFIPTQIQLSEFVRERLNVLRAKALHRRVQITSRLHSSPPVFVPAEPLEKVIDGLVKNAIENTPDEGKIEVSVRKQGEGSELVIHDYGIGIGSEAQRRIFEGFFATQETMDYSSKTPFDFNAGGRGADLLRIKVFSERYNFKISMDSSLCRHLSEPGTVCPGRISECGYCSEEKDCHDSGGTIFTIYFPPPAKNT